MLAALEAGPAAEELRGLVQAAPRGLPIVVLLQRADPDGVVALFRSGAADVVVGIGDPGELCARLEARVRDSGDAAHARRVSVQTSRLFDSFQEVALGVRPEEVLHTLVLRLGESLDLALCACVLWSVGQRQARVIARTDKPKQRDEAVDPAAYPEVLEAVRREETVLIADATRDPLFAGVAGGQARGALAQVRGALAVPLLRQGRAIGAVALRSRRGDALGSEEIVLIERLVQGTARLLESLDRRSAIDRRHTVTDLRDPLTGCASLDSLDRRVKEEVDRARRYGLSFSLVLLDVEGLERLNQRFGTEVGDRALADLGALLQREIRGPDFVARYGGDEFALILPETMLDGARRSVHRVRARVNDHLFADLGPEEPVLLSAGIVTFPHPAAVHAEDLFALAERALEQAKAQGGERIGVAGTGVDGKALRTGE